MNDREIVDVRVNLLLAANVLFPEHDRLVESVTLFESNDLLVRLLDPGNSKDFRNSLRDVFRDNAAKDNAAIHEMERTLIVPDVEITLKARAFERDEIRIHKGKIFLGRRELTEGNWLRVSQEIVVVYNTLVNELFKICPNERWIRAEMPWSSSGTLYRNATSDFPGCLNVWRTEFKKMPSKDWTGGVSFAIGDNKMEIWDSHVAEATINRDSLGVIKVAIDDITSSRATLPVPWEYLYHAFRHLASDEVRYAIIDLDIAMDFAVREVIGRRVRLDRKHIDRILSTSSTGDLLTIAQATAEDDNDFETWEVLKELHKLRGTVVHKYQRRFSRAHLSVIEKSRTAIVSLLTKQCT
ncbi:MAG TPA: hypothetical protein VGA85_07010 [Dehalococcoidales bacterium]